MRDCLLRSFAVLLTFTVVQPAHAYVYCITEVKEIQPHKDNGFVYFKFADGTAVHATGDNEGRERNFAIALAALIAGRPVKVALNDGQTCGVNNFTDWSYLMAL